MSNQNDVNEDDVRAASQHIASTYLSPVTRSAHAAKAQPQDNTKTQDKHAGNKDLDRKRQIHEALASHHRAAFHRDNTSLEAARRTSQILVDASKPEDDTDPKGK